MRARVEIVQRRKVPLPLGLVDPRVTSVPDQKNKPITASELETVVRRYKLAGGLVKALPDTFDQQRDAHLRSEHLSKQLLG